MTALDAAIALLAGKQYGVFSRLQALERGATSALITRRLRSGAWVKVAIGVYALPAHPRSYRQRLWIGHLALGHDSVVSHDAAARLHNFWGFRPRAVTFTVPHGAHPRLPGVTVHQIDDLFAFPHHVTTMFGLRVTTPARTFMDLAGERKWSARLTRSFNDAWIARIVILRDQFAVLADVARPRKPGVTRMVQILAAYRPDKRPPDSVLEQMFERACRDFGLRLPIAQAPHPGRDLPNSCIDGLYAAEKVIVELDGRDAHARLADRARDAHRDRMAARAGYLTVRFTYEEMANDPAGCIDDLRVILADRIAASA